MGIELTTKEIGAEKVYYDGYSEQAIDSDISLPDYCPDIMRILKCVVSANISTSKIIGDRASADGTAKINIIYSDEKNNLCSYSTDYPFSKYAELSSVYDSASLVCSCKTEYVNCRAVSKRRVDIHGVMSVHFKVLGTSCESVITSACGSGIQLKRKGIEASCVTGTVVKNFQLSHVENAGEALPGIGKVLSCCAAPLLSETKIIKGKLLMKGELAVHVTYCSDSNDNTAAVLSCSIPFNEIAESASFNDKCTAEISLRTVQLSAEPKTDNDGEYRYMNISAEICACISAFENSEINIINDAYSTQNEIESKYSLMTFKKYLSSFSDIAMCRQSIDIASLNPRKIIAEIPSDTESKCTFKDGKITVTGKIPLCFILVDSDGTPMSCEREAEFEFSKSVEGISQNCVCSCQVEISGYSCSLNSDGNAEFKAELCISAFIYTQTEEKVLSVLSVPDCDSVKPHKSSLTLYFCSGGESLWDIARHYNTTVEEIMEENELSSDCPENKTMLLIPIK